MKKITLTLRMKKGKKQDSKFVIYKGTRFQLQPGHSVYECNTDTGIVKEHKLVLAFSWPWQKRTFKPVYKENLIHTPAYNLERAVIVFKGMCKGLPIKIRSL